MPAVRALIGVEAGSFEPRYWSVTDPTTGTPLDLTAPGYAARMEVEDNHGVTLLAFTDTTGLRRTASGRIYFEPSSATSRTWPRMRASYQLELSHPSGQTVRIGYGPFSVDYEFIKD